MTTKVNANKQVVEYVNAAYKRNTDSEWVDLPATSNVTKVFACAASDLEITTAGLSFPQSAEAHTPRHQEITKRTISRAFAKVNFTRDQMTNFKCE